MDLQELNVKRVTMNIFLLFHAKDDIFARLAIPKELLNLGSGCVQMY